MNQQPASISLPVPKQEECNLAMLAHVLQIFTGFLGPLIILVVKRDSWFVKFHALQALIWQFCFVACMIAGVVFGFLMLFAAAFRDFSRLHGPSSPAAFFLFFPILWLFAIGGWVLNVILGIVYAMKANQGEWAGYPIIGKWFLPKPAADTPGPAQAWAR